MELQSFWLLMAHLDLYSLVFDNDCDQKIAENRAVQQTLTSAVVHTLPRLWKEIGITPWLHALEGE